VTRDLEKGLQLFEVHTSTQPSAFSDQFQALAPARGRAKY
jgi:hypothetical protein